eukprot:369348-Alexandrium_andersonii.AAC.1
MLLACSDGIALALGAGVLWSTPGVEVGLGVLMPLAGSDRKGTRPALSVPCSRSYTTGRRTR